MLTAWKSDVLTVAQRYVVNRAQTTDGWQPFAIDLRRGYEGRRTIHALVTRKGRVARILADGTMIRSIDGGKTYG